MDLKSTSKDTPSAVRGSADGETGVRVGDRFRSRADHTMVVTVDCEPYDRRKWDRRTDAYKIEQAVSVSRSTSRRTQAILVRRLLSSAYERLEP